MPVAEYYEPLVQDKIFGRYIQETNTVIVCVKSKFWVGNTLHELGHVLLQEQPWRYEYFKKSLTQDELKKYREYQETTKTTSFSDKWKSSVNEIFCESFAKRYSPNYKTLTWITSPYNPAVDLKTEEPVEMVQIEEN